MKRALIIHGWGGTPHEHWLPWLRQQLETRGWQVKAPTMPHTDAPVIDEWVDTLAEAVGELDADTYFVGHSVGCQTILRYLATQRGKKAGGCVFVAGWLALENLESPQVEKTAEPWLKDDIDFAAVKSVTTNFTVINSSNDDYGAVEENQRLFKEKLGVDVVLLPNRGHFTESDGIITLPEALSAFP